jgi:integrase
MTLPQAVWSLDGQWVELHQNVWRIRASADGGRVLVLNWQRLASVGVFQAAALTLCQAFVCERIQRRKGSTVYNDFVTLGLFARWLKTTGRVPENGFAWTDYTPATAGAFLHWGLTQLADRGNAFSRLRVLYTWGVARQQPGFSAQTLRALKAVTAPGNVKGQQVQSRHPTQGPLSTEEKWLVSRALREQVGEGHDRALVMLLLELGCNPNALVRLKRSDLHRIDAPDGPLFQLDIPRLKKRTAHRETKRRSVSARLGTLLEKLCLAEPYSRLLHWLSEQHPEGSVNTALRRWVTQNHLVSPRTGEILHLHARRFRYTLAVHLAEEGASRFHIAELLDHTDLQNVEVYITNTSRIADQVAEATDAVLRPLVQRFLGKVVETLDEPAFPDLPENVVIPAASPHLPLFSVGGVGVCGRNTRRDGLCQLLPPLSCYSCSLFAALRTGPHEEVLASMDAYLQANRSTVDVRILQQLDDVRAAIQQVVNQVKKADEHRPE